LHTALLASLPEPEGMSACQHARMDNEEVSKRIREVGRENEEKRKGRCFGGCNATLNRIPAHILKIAYFYGFVKNRYIHGHKFFFMTVSRFKKIKLRLDL
jgi:hypothetical protein